MRIPTFSQFQNQSALISKQYEKLSMLFVQGSIGKKLLASSDDPVLAAQIKSQENMISDLDSYANNDTLAQNRSSLFLNSIRGAVGIQTDIQTLIKKVQGGTMSDKNKESIAEELTGKLSQLLTLANTQDAGGVYIYSGFSATTTPYVLANGSYQYQGDYNQSTIDVGPGSSALFYENGFKVFGDIFNGNGKFTINAGAGNTGSAKTTPGSIVDSSAYVPDTYTLSFVTNSSGNLAYQVTGSSGGQIVPAPPATLPSDAPTYNSNLDLSFKGINFNVSGTPKVGDTFTVAPSTQKNVFNSLQDLITLIKSPVTNQGIFDQQLSQLSESFSQISQHLIVNQSQMGTQAAAIDNQIQSNINTITSYEDTLSGLSDVDLPQVYSAIAQKSTALEATQKSYMDLQKVLLELMRM